MCSSIFKTVATSCHLLRLKCIKFDFGWGLAPDPELTALPETASLDLRGPISKEREGKEEKGEEKPL